MRYQVIIIDNSLKLDKGKIGRVCALVTAMLLLQQKYKVTYSDIWKCIVLKSNNYGEIMDYLNDVGQDFEVHVDAGRTQVKAHTNCGLSFIMPSGTKYPKISELKLM